MKKQTNCHRHPCRFLSFVLLLFIGIFIATCADASETNESALRDMFSGFLSKYKKRYNDLEEYQKRFEIFKQNVAIAEKMNAENAETTFGITKFMDMSRDEFKQKYLSKPINVDEIKSKLPVLDYHDIVPRTREEIVLPENFNWRDHGAVTYVKDQGQCGSCWAFSTTGNIEGQWFLAGHDLVTLSEQQLVDCDHFCDPTDPTSCDEGCNGGIMTNAYRWIINNTFIATDDSYPYYAEDLKCKTKGVEFGAKIDSFKMLPEDEGLLRAMLVNQGPLSVAINADDLQYYKSGVMYPGSCRNKEINHGVLITGYGSSKSWFSDKRTWWWIVKNSWGQDWGEDGYFSIILGESACKINSFVTTSIINKNSTNLH